MSVLKQLARALGKDPKTVKRWARRGYVPGATWTKGGHLKIPQGVNAKEVMRLAKAHGKIRNRRNPKEISHSDLLRKLLAPGIDAAAKIWKNTEWMRSDEYRAALGAYLANLSLTDDVQGVTIPPGDERYESVWEEPFSPGTECYEKVHRKFLSRGSPKEEAQKANLLLAANRISADGERITAKALAKRLGISRPTLFRRFSKDERQAAYALHDQKAPPTEKVQTGRKNTVHKDRETNITGKRGV